MVDTWGLSPHAFGIRVRVSYLVPSTNERSFMFRVWYSDRWIENIPVQEAVVFKEEGYIVLRMDLPYTTPPTAR